MYDRVVPLMTGAVRPLGIDLRYLPMRIEEVFWRALRHREFDVSEISLAYYIALRSRRDLTYTAIPVFPSRFFRQGCIFVPADSPLRSLDSLKGTTVGVPEYSMTACVWLRGLLADDHGITPSDIHWRYGGIEAPGRRERAELPRIEGVDLRPIGADECLTDLLAATRLDAVISPRIPSGFWDGRVRHLLEDYRAEELRWYERTKIFPPMHTIVIKTELHARHPWIARSLFDAFQEAKHRAYEWLADINALPISLPFYMAEYELTRALFGPDPWRDGLEANRSALELLVRYLCEQGIAEPIRLEELFAPETLDEAVI
jgi:4,5-dihydroxyphthalate decarboxylase